MATFTHGIPDRGELIRESDEALYAAKSGGRNLVLHAELADAPATEPAAEAGGRTFG